jgi:hypothetical protein
MKRLLYLLPLLCLAWKPYTISDRMDKRDISAINQNFDRLQYEGGNYVTKSGTQTITGYKTFSNPLIVSSGIVGTTTNDSAAVGFVGEYISSATAGAINAPTSAEFGDLVSISLTAGDWDVTGTIHWDGNGATWSRGQIGISATSGNSTTGQVIGTNRFLNSFADSATAITSIMMCVPSYRVSLATTTTIYLKYAASYSAGTPQAQGRISARRVR